MKCSPNSASFTESVQSLRDADSRLMIPNRGKSRGGSFGVIGRNLLPLLYNDGKPAPMSNGLLPLHSAQDGTESLNVADVDVIRNRPIKLCRLVYGSGYCGRLESMVKLLWC